MLSGCKDEPEPLDVIAERAGSQSTPIQDPSQKRRKRKPKRSKLLFTPRITQWFPATPKPLDQNPASSQADPSPAMPPTQPKSKKRATRKKTAAPPPLILPSSPKNSVGSLPSPTTPEQASSKKTSQQTNQTCGGKEDLAPKKERSQHFPSQTCSMEGAVNGYLDL